MRSGHAKTSKNYAKEQQLKTDITNDIFQMTAN